VRNIPLKMGKMGRSVNYFVNLGAKCHYSKIGCNESSFPKKRWCYHVNVIYPKVYLKLKKKN
jgi:hypothetical protein